MPFNSHKLFLYKLMWYQLIKKIDIMYKILNIWPHKCIWLVTHLKLLIKYLSSYFIDVQLLSMLYFVIGSNNCFTVSVLNFCFQNFYDYIIIPYLLKRLCTCEYICYLMRRMTKNIIFHCWINALFDNKIWCKNIKLNYIYSFIFVIYIQYHITWIMTLNRLYYIYIYITILLTVPKRFRF